MGKIDLTRLSNKEKKLIIEICRLKFLQGFLYGLILALFIIFIVWI